MKIIALLILMLVCHIQTKHQDLASQIDQVVRNSPQGIAKFVDAVGTGIHKLQAQAKDGHSVFGSDRELGTLWQNTLTCKICHASMNSFDYIFDLPVVRNVAETIAAIACSPFIDYRVCAGAVHAMAEIIIPQITQGLLSASYSCSRLMGFCASPKYKTLDNADYINEMLKDKPEFLKNNDYVNTKYEEIGNDLNPRKTVKILHITDLHLDFDYTEGMNADCGEPL
jgi:hypothetical protein